MTDIRTDWKQLISTIFKRRDQYDLDPTFRKEKEREIAKAREDSIRKQINEKGDHSVALILVSQYSGHFITEELSTWLSEERNRLSQLVRKENVMKWWIWKVEWDGASCVDVLQWRLEVLDGSKEAMLLDGLLKIALARLGRSKCD